MFFSFELVHDVFSQLHDVSDIDVAAQECVADLLEALLHGLLVDDGGLVELLQGRSDLAAQISQHHPNPIIIIRHPYVHTPIPPPLRNTDRQYQGDKERISRPYMRVRGTNEPPYP